MKVIANYLPQLLLRRILYRGRKCVPSAGKRRVQYDCVHRETTMRPSAGGISAFLKRQCESDMVVFSHC